MQTPDETPTLFGPETDLFLTREQITQEERGRRRIELLAALARSDLGTIEAKVAQILQDYPETRESDTELAIRLWLRWCGKVLADNDSMGIRVLHLLKPGLESITRARRRVQNTLGLFQGSPRTQLFRGELQLEFHNYSKEVSGNEPEIRFYLDESGNESNSEFVSVGGVCIIDWRQYEKYHAALTQWRANCGRLHPFHFMTLGDSEESVYMKWLDQLQKYRGGLLFCGYALQAQRGANLHLRYIYLHLIMDSLHRLEKAGCLNEPRRLVIEKESETGFDRFELPTLNAELSQLVHAKFDQRIKFESVKSSPKGSDVMLEYADVIASSIVRRLKHPNSHAKSRVSDAVLRVTGLNQDGEQAVFQLFQLSGKL